MIQHLKRLWLSNQDAPEHEPILTLSLFEPSQREARKHDQSASGCRAIRINPKLFFADPEGSELLVHGTRIQVQKGTRAGVVFQTLKASPALT